MLEFFKEIYTSVKSNSSERAKNYYVGAFLFSWITINWKFVLTLLFSTGDIDNRISKSSSFLTTDNILLNPITMSVILCLGLPVINMIIAYAQRFPNHYLREDSHSTKVNRLKHEIETETLRAERDIAYQKKNVSESLEVQELQAQIQESKDISSKLSEENILLKEEATKVTKSLASLTEENGHLRTMISESTKTKKNMDSTLGQINSENTALKKQLDLLKQKTIEKENETTSIIDNLTQQKHSIQNEANQLANKNDELHKEIEKLKKNIASNTLGAGLPKYGTGNGANNSLADSMIKNAIESATFQAMRQTIDSPTIKSIRQTIDNPAMKAVRDAINSPIAKTMRDASILSPSVTSLSEVESGENKSLDKDAKIPPESLENK
ncbi:TPA: hypothetical protein ACJI3N_005207 [Raoultella planticola]